MATYIRWIVFVFVCSASVDHNLRGSWLSDFTGVNIDIPAGRVQFGPPQPIQGIQRLPAAIAGLPQDFANLMNPAGVGLAFAIRQAKAQAAAGSLPLPPNVFQVLQPYFPPEVLQSVRFNTFDRAQIRLDSAIMMLNNDVSAVTLEDITVFRSQADAQQNYLLWAHELTHVMQYRSRGIDTFANTYTTNAWVLENEAKDRANWVYQQTQRNQGQQSQNPYGYGYFNINGGLYIADQAGFVYPGDPSNGLIAGPSVGKMTFQNGNYIAYDLRGFPYLAVRLG